MAGLMDKLQKMWNPPDDEYEYDDDYGEEEEQPEEKTSYREEPRQTRAVSSFSGFSVSGSGSSSFSSRDNSYTSKEASYTPRERSYTPDYDQGYSQGKVVNINAKTQLQVVLCKPSSFGEEVRSIADELLRRHTVVLNLEKTEKEISRRIVDFLSGVAYANNGKIKRIATSTFIITPYTVDLTGDDVLDELESNGLYF